MKSRNTYSSSTSYGQNIPASTRDVVTAHVDVVPAGCSKGMILKHIAIRREWSLFLEPVMTQAEFIAAVDEINNGIATAIASNAMWFKIKQNHCHNVVQVLLYLGWLLLNLGLLFLPWCWMRGNAHVLAWQALHRGVSDFNAKFQGKILARFSEHREDIVTSRVTGAVITGNALSTTEATEHQTIWTFWIEFQIAHV